MDDQEYADIQALIERMRNSADAVHSFAPADNVQKLTDAVMDLRQGANTIEDLLGRIGQTQSNLTRY